MYNHNKAQQSKNRVHISWDILYSTTKACHYFPDGGELESYTYSPTVFRWKMKPEMLASCQAILKSEEYDNITLTLITINRLPGE